MKTQVAIIGGGLAGLVLARRLDESRVNFQLFEARSRFGGRIAALQTPNGAVDLGPSWFWPGQPRLAALLKALDLTDFAQYATGDQCYEDETGRVHRGMGFASMEGSLRIAGGVVRLVDALVASLPEDQSAVRKTDLRSKPWHRRRRVVPIEPPEILALQVIDFAGAIFVPNSHLSNMDNLACQDAIF